MPYHIEPSGPGKFLVKDDAGETVGEHPTRKQAVKHLQALYANVPDAKEISGTPTAVMPHGAGGLMNAPGLETDEKATDDPGDYLIVEDREHPTTWHLQVRTNGAPDHRLMGAAWAALHGGYRGNKYEGPGKQEAIDKLKKLYEAEKMPLPGEKEAQPSILDKVIAALTGKEGKRNSNTDAERLQQIHDLSVANGAQCPLVFKQANGQHRWVLFSSNAYLDRDKEIIKQAALEADVVRTDKEAGGDYGPLRWWHMGAPDPIERLAGDGADIGTCDYRAMSGRVLIESGTFVNERLGAAIKERAGDLAGSIGFFHPTDEPDQEGVYHNIYVFERSLLPRGKASNPLTALTVMKGNQDMATSKEKFDALAALLGDTSLAESVVKQAEATEKAADDRGLKYKEGEPTPEAETDKAKSDEGKPGEEKTEPKTEAAAEPDWEAMAKWLAPHLMKMIDEKMAAAKKEQTDKEAGVTAQIAALETQVKELIGEQPRGLRSGFRASLSEATILTDVKFKDASQGDPLDSVVDQLMGVKR